MVEDMIGQYQKLQDLDETFPEMMKKVNKKKNGQLFRKGESNESMEYHVQFPIETKLVEVDNSSAPMLKLPTS